MIDGDSVIRNQSDALKTRNPSQVEGKKISKEGEVAQGRLQKARDFLSKITSKEPLQFGDIQRIIENSSKNSKKYKDFYNIVTSGKLDSLQEKKAYDFISEAFRAIEHDQSPRAWVQKADLLDAIDALVLKDPSRFSPIKITPKKDFDEKWDEADIPLIPLSKAFDATERIADARTREVAQDSLTPKEKETLRGLEKEGLVVKESTKTAKFVQKVTRRDFRGAALLGGFFRLLTRIVGFHYGSPPWFGNTLDSIAKVSQDMGISSIKEVAMKVSEPEKEEFYYRGPRFLFGHSVHDYKSVNEWFVRDLTDEARALHLEKANNLSSDIDRRYGKLEEPYSRVGIFNSDCRVRVHKIEAGKFGEERELTGKVLSRKAEEEAISKRDNARYYEEEYMFSAKNLVGRETDDDVAPRALSNESVDLLKRAARILAEREPSTTPKNQKDALKLGEKAIKNAQHELLGFFYRSFEEEGAHEVIQRLAPADIHNYVSPVSGKPLSHLEAVQYLKESLEANEKRIASSDIPNEELLAAIEKEKEVLKQLEEVFTAQQTILGRPSQSTIDVYGTNMPVAGVAIDSQSRILAQNDRKIMFLRHDDGSLSMHVFIGATGVNRVDVNPSTDRQAQGARTGDMGFGEDIYNTDKKLQLHKASSITTRDGIHKLELGEAFGDFRIDGSTVISYYRPTDFSFAPQVDNYRLKAEAGVGASIGGEREQRKIIELKVDMGDVALIKTEIALVDALERNVDFDPELDYLQFLGFVQNTLDLKEVESPSDRENLSLFKKLLGKESALSHQELELREKVIKALQDRLEKIKELENRGVKEKDIAPFAIDPFAENVVFVEEKRPNRDPFKENPFYNYGSNNPFYRGKESEIS